MTIRTVKDSQKKNTVLSWTHYKFVTKQCEMNHGKTSWRKLNKVQWLISAKTKLLCLSNKTSIKLVISVFLLSPTPRLQILMKSVQNRLLLRYSLVHSNQNKIISKHKYQGMSTLSNIMDSCYNIKASIWTIQLSEHERSIKANTKTKCIKSAGIPELEYALENHVEV